MALAYIAILLSFAVNSCDLLTPIKLSYRNITINFSILQNNALKRKLVPLLDVQNRTYLTKNVNFAFELSAELSRVSEDGNKKTATEKSVAVICCCGGRTRTYDLWVMSPTSYQLLHPRDLEAQIYTYLSTKQTVSVFCSLRYTQAA